MYMIRNMRNRPFWRAPNEDSDQPANPRSLIKVFIVRKKELQPLLSKMRSVKVLIAQADLNGWSEFSLGHISKGTVSDVVAHVWWPYLPALMKSSQAIRCLSIYALNRMGIHNLSLITVFAEHVIRFRSSQRNLFVKLLLNYSTIGLKVPLCRPLIRNAEK